MTYLDHAATTPMRPEALAALTASGAVAGNASSLHASGRRARRVVEESREVLAGLLGARPSDVVFTGGGTESDNLALKGLFWARRAAEPARRRILVSAVEHRAVLDTVAWLSAAQGAEVELLEVDAAGTVHPETLEAALARDPDSVAVVSVMWANSEVGTVQPVAALAGVAHRHGVPFHTDAVQAFGQLPVTVNASGIATGEDAPDAITISAHKVGGPVGVGALVVRRGLVLQPLTHGGGQERDIRSGTLNTAGAAAFAAAATAACEHLPRESARLAALRDDLVRRVQHEVPGAILNGAPLAGPPGAPRRLPGNAHLTFPGCEGDSLLMLLDARGIECSTGSACSAGVARPSHVLLAMGASDEHARSSLRFSLGHTSRAADVDALVEAIGPVVERASRAGVTV
ncbi:IscS-like cysteine desulfurase [Frankia canadensis]|uniref:IscS-like cysteine desulfurase n=1 Tax=Frankia canadensis TaxID=1836972 RepID=A0A2I2KJ56_9ACTN|nr:cysteine desulfurase family protein [Frankia canadensis]SNQ45690.1 IscS-like cysteine desulfurase [Frankia canadensis]SOU52980.1 IscS-like cysteine desulfurase [Frankia canadensis]